MMNVDEVAAGVRQVIADAERYKRERDEAVGLLLHPGLGVNGPFLKLVDDFLDRVKVADDDPPH